ncbi:MAG TPA: class I mannose-6-phosphate isomerase [Clostridiales bacterium]|nr:class I mannose-6-phosphate isomerase [Clostridiales bacterium]
MEALKLIPEFKDYIWGGTKLRDEYNKKCDYKKIAESWELSCHKDGNSVIENGEYSGFSLTEYIQKVGNAVLGSACDKFESFPILIKLIDAKDNLSVQVHPDNDYALRVEGEYGKTEMWYIVDCDEGASLLYGFNENITKDEFKKHIENNSLLEVANSVNVKKGDVFFIEAGTLHAIGKGILIAEIQQNSNTTYRIYDYGRVGNDGKPRELHIDKAVEVTDLCPAKEYPEQPVEKYDGYNMKLLSSCEYFSVYNIELKSKALLNADKISFNSMLILDGEGTLNGLAENSNSISFKKGDSIFIPAEFGEYEIIGKANIIYTGIGI